MRHKLMAILLAGAALFGGAPNVRAGPQELNSRLVTECKQPLLDEFGEGYYHEYERDSKRGYKLCVFGSNYNPSQGNINQKTLNFRIEDPKTRISIHDRGADGLSKDDFLSLNHNCGNKEFSLDITYDGNEQYTLSGALYTKAGPIDSFKVKTEELNPLFRYLVKRKSAPFLEFGQQLYSDLVKAEETGQEANLPYEDMKQALKRVDSAIQNDLDNLKEFKKTMIDLCEDYTRIAKQKLKTNGGAR
jgi:hypothetical protein